MSKFCENHSACFDAIPLNRPIKHDIILKKHITTTQDIRSAFMEPRISKENYYLNIAETVLERATCLRRVFGAIIVKNDEIISGYELCRSVHAEANAIISAARRDMVGGTLYLVGRNAQTGELLHDATSCAMCRRMVINAGLSKVVIRHTERDFSVVDVQDWVDLEDDIPTPQA